MKNLIIAMCVLSLAACAAASKPGAMVANVTEATIIQDTSQLHENVTVGEVGGGKDTNPLWASKVSSVDFAEALRQTFAAHAMLATDEGDYRLDAELVKLKQPFAGFNMTVTSIVDYTLTHVESGEVVLEETVETAYTAKAGDAFMGVKRLQLANEGSIKGNISTLIEKMIAAVDGAETMKTPAEESIEDGTEDASS